VAGARLASWSQKGFNYGTFDFGDDNVFVPYLGALYDLTPNHRLYASYTEIFQPQNARDYTGAYLDPITGESSELGLKSAFFGERLQTTVAVFRIVQDNLAQTDPDATHIIPGSSPPTRASIAAKGATSKGFELEVIGKPLDELEHLAGLQPVPDARRERRQGQHRVPAPADQAVHHLPPVGAPGRPGRRRRRQLAERGLFGLDQSVTGAPFRFEQKATPWSA
jgi:outer membrane receptor for ferric coprogen and ferric-rhodotorulic acid